MTDARETISVADHLQRVIDEHEKLDQERDRRIAERFQLGDKAVADALRAAALATEKAEEQAEQWRANANEWRQAMTDREARFATAEALGALTSRLDRIEGRTSGLGQGIAWLVAAVMGAAAIVSIAKAWP